MRLIDADKLPYEDIESVDGNTYMCVNAYDIDRASTIEMAEDCISREEAIRIAEQGQIQGYEWQFKELCNLLSVTPQQKIGRWIAEINDYGEVMGWHCDKCYEDSGFTTTCKWDFCPNCGADMRNED
ncbi:MAG: hypothetical protein J6S67_16255 [Methanobrevibacter sp.]|nr:hypothetical protein [Methanobrevibacter sp.]